VTTADTALADQFQAAEAHLERILKAAAPAIGLTREATPTPWLAARLDTFADDLFGGRVTTCHHLTAAHGPAPAFGVLNGGPGLVVCRRCMHRLTGDETLSCDRCAAQVPEFALCTVQLGNLALLIVLCGECDQLDESETGPAAG
jgi:hypothetical protein